MHAKKTSTFSPPGSRRKKLLSFSEKTKIAGSEITKTKNGISRVRPNCSFDFGERSITMLVRFVWPPNKSTVDMNSTDDIISND